MVVTCACAVVLVAGSAGLVAKVGNPFDWASSQFSGGECVNDPGRFTELCANNRVDWWREAGRIGADHPVGGTGAGTFAIARKRHRETATPVSEPHSVPLQLLADLGVVGLALGLVAAVAAAVGIRRSLSRVPGAERPAAAALACLALVYALHSLVDYDLDFLAVTGPLLVAVGALLGAARPPSSLRARVPGSSHSARSRLRRRSAIALPALAERDVDRALAAIEEGRLSDAADAADRARLLNPLSLGPLRARASQRTPRATVPPPLPGTRRRPSSSRRTPTPGTSWGSTTRSRPATSARPTRR